MSFGSDMLLDDVAYIYKNEKKTGTAVPADKQADNLQLQTILDKMNDNLAVDVAKWKLNADGVVVPVEPIVMTFLFEDESTKVLYSGKKTNAFCLVKLSDGTSGYVFRDFLSEYGAVSSSKVYRTTQKAKVYKKPSTSSSKVVTLSKNAFVMVYATKSGWAYVKTVSGKGGYMKLSALTKA